MKIVAQQIPLEKQFTYVPGDGVTQSFVQVPLEMTEGIQPRVRHRGRLEKVVRLVAFGDVADAIYELYEAAMSAGKSLRGLINPAVGITRKRRGECEAVAWQVGEAKDRFLIAMENGETVVDYPDDGAPATAPTGEDIPF